MKNHPLASAATVAAGVGAFFLVREFLTGKSSGPAKKVAGIKSAAPKKQAAIKAKSKKSAPAKATKIAGKTKAKSKTSKQR